MFDIDLKTYLGVILFLVAAIGMLLNLTVAGPVFRLALAKDKSSIYVISCFNIINDIVHLILSTFYLAPSIIFDSFLISQEKNSRIVVLISFVFMFCWYIGNIIQIVMALNRWAVICFRNTSVFTKRNLLILFVFTIAFAAIKSYIIQYVLPCCVFIVDHTVLSYSYYLIDDIPNYTDQSDIPLNALSSIIPVICYTWIFINLRSSSKSICPSMKGDMQKLRSRQELTYAMQFCLISIFYTFSWIMFRVFPIIFDGRKIEWYILTSICHVFNCTSNAFVYVIFNKEIKRQLTLNRIFRLSMKYSSDRHHSTEYQSQSKCYSIPIPTARRQQTI